MTRVDAQLPQVGLWSKRRRLVWLGCLVGWNKTDVSAKRVELEQAAVDRQDSGRHDELLAEEGRIAKTRDWSEFQSTARSFNCDARRSAGNVSERNLCTGGRDSLDVVDNIAHEAGCSQSVLVGIFALLFMNLKL